MEKKKDLKRLTLDIPPELHHDLKVIAADTNTNMKALLMECAEKIVKEKGKKKTAKESA